MRRLQGYAADHAEREKAPFKTDKIVIELDHDRAIVITRSTSRGNDSIQISCGIDRKDVAANGRFVIRTGAFNTFELTVEQLR